MKRLNSGLNSDDNAQYNKDEIFALNSVIETKEGDQFSRSNENGNEVYSTLPADYIPIGKAYMTNNRIAVIIVKKDNSHAIIATIEKDKTYVAHATDIASTVKFGFKVENQVDVIYANRLGREDTIYIVGKDFKPYFFSYNKPEEFKTAGNWDIAKFNLIKETDQIPNIDSMEVINGGSITPGSVNFAFIYLDENYNPTNPIITTKPINIYNDSGSYNNIQGSSGYLSAELGYGKANKSVKITLSNLDQSFSYYKMAIIEAIDNVGEVSSVSYSDPISTKNNIYIYDGKVGEKTSLEEILIDNLVIEHAKHVEILDSTLLLGSVKSDKNGLDLLQKYASKIKAEYVVKEVIINDMNDPSNAKSPTIHFQGTGYLPGEIYPFNISYIFKKDKYVTPSYHIPGSNTLSTSNMLKTDENECDSVFYDTRLDTYGDDFWGVDETNTPLTGEKVRHHRFPLRSQSLIGFVSSTTTPTNYTLYRLVLKLNPLVIGATVITRVIYTTNGTIYTFDFTNDFYTHDGAVDKFVDIVTSTSPISGISIQEFDVNFVPQASVFTYTPNLTSSVYTSTTGLSKVPIYGIKFSNIIKPDIGEEIDSFIITRQERTDINKSIIDYGVLMPMSKFGNTIAIVQSAAIRGAISYSLDSFALINPENKFLKKSTVPDLIIQEGHYEVTNRFVNWNRIEDVAPGSSFDPEKMKRGEKDNDGFDLKPVGRMNIVEFDNSSRKIFATSSQIKGLNYLDAVSQSTFDDSDDVATEYLNLTSDNIVGLLRLKVKLSATNLSTQLPYVVLKKDIPNPYSDYLTAPCYVESPNVHYFLSPIESVTLFSGDSYVNPMRYSQSYLHNVVNKNRDLKSGVGNIVLGSLLITASVIAAIATGGAATPLVATLVGQGVLQISTGIKKEQVARLYYGADNANVKEVVKDEGLGYIGHPNKDLAFSKDPNDLADDEIQWCIDTLADLFIESSVNFGLRLELPTVKTNFLKPLTPYDAADNTGYLINKITGVSVDDANERLYLGVAAPETYVINLDYQRRNREKVYFNLPTNYTRDEDNEFFNRIHFSEQSFQESLKDYKRIFLANNYIDLPGESGRLTNIFSLNGKLYALTEEALWFIPNGRQERLTNEGVVTYIGKGDYLSLPPVKIIDDSSGNSYGTSHKWGCIKAAGNYYYICEKQKTVIEFNGRNVKELPLNSKMFSFFKENTQIDLDKDYYNSRAIEYPFKDNPSNPYGTGFISTYDERLKRVIFTKKDFFNQVLYETTISSKLIYNNGTLKVFNNYQQTINDNIALGYFYQGIIDGKMQFYKNIAVIENIKKRIKLTGNLEVKFIYNSNHFSAIDNPALVPANIDNLFTAFIAALQWQLFIEIGHTDPIPYTVDIKTDSRWMDRCTNIKATDYGGVVSTVELLVIELLSSSQPDYYNNPLDSDQSTNPAFVADLASYQADYPTYEAYYQIAMPILGRGINLHKAANPFSLNVFAHTIAMIEDIRNNFDVTLGYGIFANTTDTTILTSTDRGNIYNSLLATIPTIDLGLESPLGSVYPIGGVYSESIPTAGVTDYGVANDDIKREPMSLLYKLLELEKTYSEEVFIKEYLYVEGTDLNLELKLDKSWTISYALKRQRFASFHSYLPSMYFNTPDNFFSYVNSDPNIAPTNDIWIHNVSNVFNQYYNRINDYIVETALNFEDIKDYFTESINFQTEAFRFDFSLEEFYSDDQKTFNKIILYNTRQCTWGMDLSPKVQDGTYLSQQIKNSNIAALIDKNQKDWHLNNITDLVIDNSHPFFKKDVVSLSQEYYIDKILNFAVLDVNKNWSNIERFKDKYIVARFFLQNESGVKLNFNYVYQKAIESVS